MVVTCAFDKKLQVQLSLVLPEKNYRIFCNLKFLLQK